MSEIDRLREAVRRLEMAHEALLDAIDLIPAGAMKFVAASTGRARYWLDDAIQTISSELRQAERAALRSKTGHADTPPGLTTAPGGVPMIE